MRINRRQFIGISSTTGILLLSGFKSDETRWKDVAPWSHSWDASEAVTYQDDGQDYQLKPAVRVDSIPDAIGDKVLSRDRGQITALFSLKPMPGPQYHPSNPMFEGRPSWFSDTVIPHNPDKPGYFYAWQSGITSTHNPSDGFGWKQPWWGAVLCRGVGPFVGHNRAYIDGNPGMVTIDISTTGTVQLRVWPNGVSFGPTINSELQFTEDTVLVQWLANGEDSWLEMNYRGSDGALVTRRVTGAVGNAELVQLHSGISHTNYTSCAAIAKGIPTIAQTDAVRNWAAPFIPG